MTRGFGSVVMSHFDLIRHLIAKMNASIQQVHKTNYCFNFRRLYSHRNTAIETIECLYFLCPCQKKFTYLNEEDTQRGPKKRKSMS